MIHSVISSKNMHDHNVEPYRFKVLGTTLESKPKGESEEEKKEQETKNAPVPSVPDPVKPIESAFVEELLKKTDELSTNIVKLQIKIENQEAEFERRLNDEIRRAKEDGAAEGYAKAQEEQRESMKALQTQFSRSLHLLEEEHQHFKAFLEKSETELSETAIDVAKEVVKKEITHHATAVALALSKALMKELEDATKLEVRVNPKNYEGIKEAYDSFEHIHVGTDDAVSEGGVIILSDVGNIDGTISTRLEKIKQMMKE
ncbi:MAG: flagellar assembly protein FliH [Campylobacterales bacterium]|nr:flagellar assembly protein FliH [Campylobacterales bacterium]